MKIKIINSFSKFLIVFCSLLSILFYDNLLFNKKNIAYADTEISHDGFYVQNGASVRLVKGESAFRFTIVLTKEQYEIYVADYNKNKQDNDKNATYYGRWDLYVQLGFNKKYGVDIQKGLPLKKIKMDIRAWFLENSKPYVCYVAFYFNELLDGVEKSGEELYQMFAETEVYVNYIGLDFNKDVCSCACADYETPQDAWISTKKNIEYSKNVKNNGLCLESTNRSIRSVALSLYTNGLNSFNSVEYFLLKENGTSISESDIIVDNTELFYDISIDSISITVGADKLAIVKRLYVNGHIASFTIDGDKAIISGVNAKEKLTSGKIYSFNFDAIDNVYSYNNVLVS